MAQVTMKQIAERVGMHQSTVSRILNGSRKEAWGSMAKRAEQIRQVAAEMGYRPNAAARATRQGRTGVIALVTSTSAYTSYLPWSLLSGLQHEAAKHDCRLQFTQIADAELTDPKFVQKVLRQLSADGVLIDYTHGLPERTLELIHRHNIPAIWINTKQRCDAIHPDDLAAGQTATQLLLDAGHRRIAYVDTNWGPEDARPAHYSTHDRELGYSQAMRTAGLEPRVIRQRKGVPFRERAGVLRPWLERADRPTAVVTYSADDAQPLLLAADRLGLRCPRDLSVITFGAQYAFFDQTLLTMLIEPHKAIGTQAVDALTFKIEQPARDLASRAVRFELLSGDSIAPANGGRDTSHI